MLGFMLGFMLGSMRGQVMFMLEFMLGLVMFMVLNKGQLVLTQRHQGSVGECQLLRSSHPRVHDEFQRSQTAPHFFCLAQGAGKEASFLTLFPTSTMVVQQTPLKQPVQAVQMALCALPSKKER